MISCVEIEGGGKEIPIVHDHTAQCGFDGCTNRAMWFPRVRVWPGQREKTCRMCPPAILELNIQFCKEHTPKVTVAMIEKDGAFDLCNAALKEKGFNECDTSTAEIEWVPFVSE